MLHQTILRRVALLATALVLGLGLAPSTSAQTLEKIPELTWEAEFTTDADGFLQIKPLEGKCEHCRGTGTWDCRRCERLEHKNETCLECDKTKKAPCRICAGSGKALDPTQEFACTFCSPFFGESSGLVDCGLCGADGLLTEKDKDGNENHKKCGSCKGEGRWACPVCEGTRRIQVVRVKKKHPGEAKLKDLVKLRDGLRVVLEELEAWEPINRPGKNDKALDAMFKKQKRAVPALPGFQEVLDLVIGGQVKAGSSYQNFEANMIHHYKLYRNKTIYMLQQQLRALDVYVKRAEHNDAIKERQALFSTLPWQ